MKYLSFGILGGFCPPNLHDMLRRATTFHSEPLFLFSPRIGSYFAVCVCVGLGGTANLSPSRF